MHARARRPSMTDASRQDASALDAGVSSLDRASYRNRKGLLQKAITAYKLRQYFSRWGSGNLIDASADIRITDGAWLEIGDESTILEYSLLHLTKPAPRVTIGSRSVIGRGCIISAKNLITIGDDVLMGSFVQVIDHNHGLEPGKLIREQRAELKTVRIGSDVWIGAGAKILAGCSIGDGAVIGSNSVVTDDVPAGAIVAGVPARVLRMR